MHLVISLTVLFLFVADNVCGSPVIGGRSSEIHTYPWLASIQKDDRHICGGSIISSTVILTAAHCVNHPPKSYIVRVGSSRTDSGGSWHSVVAIKQHENFNMTDLTVSGLLNDVALIKLSPSIKLGENGLVIQLPDRSDVAPVGTDVTLMGWGSMSEEGNMVYELRSSKLHIIDSGECARAYGDVTGKGIELQHLICTYGYHSDACKGDSGGPIVIRGNIQVGIVSGGRGCGDYRFPGINQDVAYFRDWIDEQLKNR